MIVNRVLLAGAGLALAGGLVGPALYRAHVDARRARMLRAVQDVFAAQSQYALLDRGRFGTLECLAEPWTCLPSYSKDRPPLLSAASYALAPERGYRRELRLSPERDRFEYWAIPERRGRGGVAICADQDYFRFYRFDDPRESFLKCDALRGAFEGAQENARARREERGRLFAARGKV